MKKLSSKSRILLLEVSMVMTILVSPSCKSVEVVGRSEVQDVQKFRSVDTVVLRDTMYRHDSVIYRERTIHDTFYITKEVYRDRLEARGERQKAVRTDTVVVTEWREKVIEHPPKRYVPKFYRWCTGLLFVGLVALAVIITLKIRKRKTSLTS